MADEETPQLLLVTEHLQDWRQGDWPAAHDLLTLGEFIERETRSRDEVNPMRNAGSEHRIHLMFDVQQSKKIRECIKLLARIDPNWKKAIANPSDAVYEILMRWLEIAVHLRVT